jgi:hypothetical protein
LCSLTLTTLRKMGPVPESFDWTAAFMKFLTAFDIEEQNGNAKMTAVACEPFVRRLDELPLASLAPASEAEARQWLAQRIERELDRVERIWAELVETVDIDAAEAPARLAFEAGTTGEKHRRYVLSTERQVIKRIDTFLKVRTAIEAGKFNPADFDPGDLPDVESAVDASTPATPCALATTGFPPLQSASCVSPAAIAESDLTAKIAPGADVAAADPIASALPVVAAGELRPIEPDGGECGTDRARIDSRAEIPATNDQSQMTNDQDCFLRNEPNRESSGPESTAEPTASRVVPNAMRMGSAWLVVLIGLGLIAARFARSEARAEHWRSNASFGVLPSRTFRPEVCFPLEYPVYAAPDRKIPPEGGTPTVGCADAGGQGRVSDGRHHDGLFVGEGSASQMARSEPRPPVRLALASGSPCAMALTSRRVGRSLALACGSPSQRGSPSRLAHPPLASPLVTDGVAFVLTRP